MHPRGQILIVDDDASIRATLAEYSVTHSGESEG